MAASQRVNVIEHTFAQVRQHEKVEAMRRFIDNEPEMYAFLAFVDQGWAQKLASQLAGMGYQLTLYMVTFTGATKPRDAAFQGKAAGFVDRYGGCVGHRCRQLDPCIPLRPASGCSGLYASQWSHRPCRLYRHFTLPDNRGESPKLERMGKTLKIECRRFAFRRRRSSGVG